MKRLLWLIVMLSAIGMIFAVSGTYTVANVRTASDLVNNTQTGLTVNYSVGNLNYNEVVTLQGNFTEIDIAGYANTNRIGLPQLPLLRQIISVPVGASVQAAITQQEQTVVSLAGMGMTHPLLPHQASVAKNVDPATVPFVIDNTFYRGAQWTNEPAVKVEELGMMRGTRLVALDFTPVQYNPASGLLNVIISATVEVTYTDADWAQTEELQQKYYSPAFEAVLAQAVFNYTPVRTSLNRYPLGLIIIAPANYEATLQPFINWKIQQGYNVTFASTAVTGTTTTSIKSYLQNIWNNATTDNPAPSYLLLCGDTAQIPAWTGSTDAGHVTDLNYVRLQGTDYVPEMYYGRFSATNLTQLQAYIDKSLQYEQYTMPDPSYLSWTTLIAGVDSSYGPTHANGQINYGTTNYFGNSTTTPFGPYGILDHVYLYPSSGSAEASIIQDMNNGLSFINYTAHGSETTWYDPSLTIANINSLTNANKYFVAVGNCCLTNAFQTSECLGEAFTRVANKGAVIYVGGTNSTYWNEDYYWAVGYKPPIVGTGSPYVPNRIGAYDALFHTHDEAFTDWVNSMGSMIMMGNLAVTQSNSSLINYYWEIYSIMGDPTLIPYMGTPLVNNATYMPVVQTGLNTMQITADPYTYVGLSQDNVLHGSGLTDASGNLTLNFTPFTTPGTAKLVMTRSLRRPVIVDIQVTSNTGPYVLLNSMTVNDGNNSIAEFGETFYLDVTVNNVGTLPASTITATVTSPSSYVTVLNGTANIANLVVNTPYTIANTFQVSISPSIPDQQSVEFDFAFSSGSDTWTATRSLTVNAPNINISSPVFYDPNNNGAFEPGEMITASFNLINTGHAAAAQGELDIVINSNYGNASQNVFLLPAMLTGISIPISFQITISSDAPTGVSIPVGLALTAGAQMVNSMFALPVGLVTEGFESNSFTAFPWINTSTIPWTIVTGAGNYHSGMYAAKSGAIGNNGLTELSINMNITTAGNITFWNRVSSESGFDFMKFYIDNTETGSWSGNLAWTQQTYPVTSGQHTFKWAYQKDYSTTAGSDCAFLDDVTFPLSGDNNIPLFYLPTTTLAFDSVELNTLVSQDLVVRNLGNVILTGSVTVPSLVSLLFNGSPVSDTYNYTIPAGGNGTFTVSIYLTAQTNVDDYIVFTTNDPSHPTQQVALHVSSVANNDPNVIPAVTRLEGNYPNPFNPMTTIRFSLKEAGPVTIYIYNTKGQLVRTLVNDKMKTGNHSFVWNGTDDKGKSVSGGVYLYRMQAGDYSQVRKMLLLK